MAMTAAQLLDELMGKDRNLVPGETSAQVHWSHEDVCRNYLCGFCPHDLFVNTKADLGPCSKIHDDQLKADYEKSSRHGHMGFEEDFARFLSSIHSDVERRIRRGHERLTINKAREEEMSVDDSDQTKMLTDHINQLLTEIESLGAEGKVEEAQGVSKLVEQLKDEREQSKNNAGSAGQEKQMEVCEVCAAFLIVGDAQSRVDDHLQGKQHVGYARIKSTIEDMKSKPWLEQKKEPTDDKEEKKDDKPDDGREKEKERDRERDRERESRRSSRRSRSRSRERKRSRDRRRSRERSDKDRSDKDRSDKDRSVRRDRERRRSRDRESRRSHRSRSPRSSRRRSRSRDGKRSSRNSSRDRRDKRSSRDRSKDRSETKEGRRSRDRSETKDSRRSRDRSETKESRRSRDRSETKNSRRSRDGSETKDNRRSRDGSEGRDEQKDSDVEKSKTLVEEQENEESSPKTNGVDSEGKQRHDSIPEERQEEVDRMDE